MELEFADILRFTSALPNLFYAFFVIIGEFSFMTVEELVTLDYISITLPFDYTSMGQTWGINFNTPQVVQDVLLEIVEFFDLILVSFQVNGEYVVLADFYLIEFLMMGILGLFPIYVLIMFITRIVRIVKTFLPVS